MQTWLHGIFKIVIIYIEWNRVYTCMRVSINYLKKKIGRLYMIGV